MHLPAMSAALATLLFDLDRLLDKKDLALLRFPKLFLADSEGQAIPVLEGVVSRPASGGCLVEFAIRSGL